MSQIFNFKRFVAYLGYDLNSARNNYLLSMLIIGLTPLWALICFELISIISGDGFAPGNSGLQIAAFLTAIVMLVITAPVKIYGHLTDKRSGSAYVMAPASTTEKFLSVLVTTCVALPLGASVILLGCDALISLLVPGFNHTVTGTISEVFYGEDPEIYFSPMVYYANWCENILAFTLGAILFKKGKAGKTFLCLMGLGTLIICIVVLFFNTTQIDSDTLVRWLGNPTPEKLQRAINWILSGIYFVAFALLMGGIYFRIKTIKH